MYLSLVNKYIKNQDAKDRFTRSRHIRKRTWIASCLKSDNSKRQRSRWSTCKSWTKISWNRKYHKWSLGNSTTSLMKSLSPKLYPFTLPFRAIGCRMPETTITERTIFGWWVKSKSFNRTLWLLEMELCRAQLYKSNPTTISWMMEISKSIWKKFFGEFCVPK